MEGAEAPDDVGGVDADDFAVGEKGLEDIGGLVVGQAAVGWEDDLGVGDVEVGVGGREALVVVEDEVGHGHLDDGGLFAVGQTAAAEHLEVALQGLVVLVPGVVLDDGEDGVGGYEAREVVDMAVGVVADDAVAKPDDVVHTVIVAQILFYLVLVEVGIAVGIEEAGGGGEEVAAAVDVDAAAFHDDAGREEGRVGHEVVDMDGDLGVQLVGVLAAPGVVVPVDDGAFSPTLL